MKVKFMLLLCMMLLTFSVCAVDDVNAAVVADSAPTSDASEPSTPPIIVNIPPSDSSTSESTILQVDNYNSKAVQQPESTLSKAVRAVFGAYTPKTKTVTTYVNGAATGTSTEIVDGVAGMDFEWLSGVLLFAVMLLSVCKIAGVLLK